MKLNPEAFDKIAFGRKTIELRLYDEKRKLVKPGDEIIFSHIQNPYRSICVVVDSMITATSFESLFKHISLVDCGYEEKEINGFNHLDMKKYYSEDRQKQCGVVGIKFSLNTHRPLSEIHVTFVEVDSFLNNHLEKNCEQTPEMNEWYNWFQSAKKDNNYSATYKKAIESNTLEASLAFFDDVISSHIFSQSMELKDKLCKDTDYDGNENILEFWY